MRYNKITSVLILYYSLVCVVLAPTTSGACIAARPSSRDATDPMRSKYRTVPGSEATKSLGEKDMISTKAAYTAETHTHGHRVSGEVTHLNVFWAIVSLAIAYITHPLGSCTSLGFMQQFHVQIHSSLAGPSLDAFFLLLEIYNNRVYHHLTVRNSIRHSVNVRARASQASVLAAEQGDNSWKTKFSSLRPVLSALGILQYVKLCGYGKIGFSFVWATLIFIPLLLLEILYYMAKINKVLPRFGSSRSLRVSTRPPIVQQTVFKIVNLVLIGLGYYNDHRASRYSHSWDSIKFWQATCGVISIPFLIPVFFDFSYEIPTQYGVFVLMSVELNMPNAEELHYWVSTVITVVAQSLLVYSFIFHNDLSASTKAGWTEKLP